MFERGHDVMAIAAERAMISVMHYDNVAAGPGRARDAR